MNNQTWTFPGYTTPPGAPVVYETKYGATALVQLAICDCHGMRIKLGDTEVKAFFEYKEAIVRSGRFTSDGIAPVIGENYTGQMYFWLPVWDDDPGDPIVGDITYKVEVYYLRYPVCDIDYTIVSTAPLPPLEELTTTLVPVVFIVKDYQKPMQPKEGVLVLSLIHI